MYAVISDIHANLEALVAVLEDIEKQGITEIYCLGDIVGYGPDPQACVEIVSANNILSVMGNHEAALFDDELIDAHFNEWAKDAVYWTREQLDPDAKNYLAKLPYTMNLPFNAVGVHSSLNNPEEFHYILPRYLDNAVGTFVQMGDKSVCFTGHTHFEAAYACKSKHAKSKRRFGIAKWTYGLVNKIPMMYEPSPKEGEPYELFNKNKYIFEVGSVGLRREIIVQGDSTSKINHRASYAIFNGQNVTYRKVGYNIDLTIAKIRDMELAPKIIARLVSHLTQV
jgi:predicted phosphodiesterase